jgi:hypothetical protein
MDLSNILVDEVNASKSGVLDGNEEGDDRSMKERLDVAEEDDPFWS